MSRKKSQQRASIFLSMSHLHSRCFDAGSTYESSIHQCKAAIGDDDAGCRKSPDRGRKLLKDPDIVRGLPRSNERQTNEEGGYDTGDADDATWRHMIQICLTGAGDNNNFRIGTVELKRPSIGEEGVGNVANRVCLHAFYKVICDELLGQCLNWGQTLQRLSNSRPA